MSIGFAYVWFYKGCQQESIENEIKRSNCEENIVQGCQKVVNCPNNRAQTDTCMYYNHFYVFLKA